MPPSQHQKKAGSLENPVIGGSSIRIDSVGKVSGTTQFAEDITVPDLLHAAVFRSPFPHARLISLDIQVTPLPPGIVRIFTAEDIPGENSLTGYSKYEPVLAHLGDTLKQKGAPIALIAASSEELAHRAFELIHADYEQLPSFYDLDGALEPQSVQLYPLGNVLNSHAVNNGDLESAFYASDFIHETEYQTSFQEHATLERETVLGTFDTEGNLTIVAATHEPHWQRDYVAQVLALRPEQVRIIVPPTGGSFGSRQDPWPLVAVGLMTYLLHRPVRLAYTRREVFDATPKRHPYHVKIKIGMNKDCRLTGMKARIDANTGGYDSAGYWIPNFAVGVSGGAYQWQAVDIRARAIFSNSPKCGQFRGYGSPQSTFALECALDELAELASLDPVEFRIRNCLHQDQVSFLGYPLGESLAYEEVLESLRSRVKELQTEAEVFNNSEAACFRRMGVGMAGMLYRFGKSGSLRIETHAELALDGHIIIYCSAPDYGQGIGTVMVQLASEVLGIPKNQIELVNTDTARVPDSGIQGASRATYFIGGSVCRSAENIKRQIIAVAAEMMDIDPSDLILRASQVESIRNANNNISLLSIAEEFDQLGKSRKVMGVFDLSPHFPVDERPEYLPLFVTGGQVAQVVVDLETGQVAVKKIVAAHDVGRVINPLDAVGQIQGAIMMGLGTALLEEYIPGQTTGFSDYILPTVDSLPDIEVILIEKPSDYGPFGAKGLGEAAILPAAPAIINAVSRAIGIRIRQIPATPPRLLAAINKR